MPKLAYQRSKYPWSASFAASHTDVEIAIVSLARATPEEKRAIRDTVNRMNVPGLGETAVAELVFKAFYQDEIAALAGRCRGGE